MRHIRSEKDAWRVLRDWVDGKTIKGVSYEGWPILRIRVVGDDYHSSLNSGQMAAMVEFKNTISRTYAMVAHGAYDLRRLRVEEEDELDFTTEVKKGSSIMETDLTPLVQALANIASSNPNSTIAAGLIIGLAIVARSLVLKHFEVRSEQIAAEERVRLTSLGRESADTEKIELFERAINLLSKSYPQMTQALPNARQAFWKFASASANAENINFAGLDLNSDELEVLSERRQKRSSDTEEVTQIFAVSGVNKDQARYKVKLESENLSVIAVFAKPNLTARKIGILTSCMHRGQKIMATLQIRVVDRAHVSARLTRFSTRGT